MGGDDGAQLFRGQPPGPALHAIAEMLGADGEVPESLDIQSGLASGTGPAGFSAAVLPLLQDTSHMQVLRRRMQTIRFDQTRYYDQVLALFAEGWLQGRYRFDAQGRLLTRWTPCSRDSQVP